MNDERRVFERVEFTVPAIICRAGTERRIHGQLMSLGAGGLRMRSEEAFGPNEQLIVTFDFPDQHGPIELSIRVLDSIHVSQGAVVRAQFDRAPKEKAAVMRIARWSLKETRSFRAQSA